MVKILRILIAIAAISACFSGCTVKGSSGDDAAKRVVTDFVTMYYTIDKTDLENYGTITGGFIETEDEDGYWRFAAAVSSENKKFEGLMTEKAYQELVDLRTGYQRIREAHEKQYISQVTGVTLQEYAKGKNTVTYYYQVEIVRAYENSGKIEQVSEKRQIEAAKLWGQWRVSKVNY